ncbi:DUF4397 domain-containing protein [Nocardioides guangzhouensis]|uniref:DUF4397 domain-containing protein n=2 Tax=Nocardioides guangzhouensis TaxID=2497878 RepID=A0A4Q4ZAV8_9ACTN|nr:DUF4397 domain-containing protein [Nocardioides guangzhouensis]
MRILAVAGFTGLAALAPLSPPAAAAAADATVTVLHAVPGLTVDVYANGDEILPDFEPGTLTDPLSLPAGSYDLQVFAAGDDPATADPAIEASGVELGAGANATVVAHLDAQGNPVLTPYVNDTSPTKPGEARLVVRHDAAAPAVDVRADGDVVFEGLANPDEQSADLPAGTYSADVTLTGEDQAVLGPTDVTLTEGTSTIVYAWGSADDDNLALAVQTIDGLHSSPTSVPGGQTGAAEASASAPWWTVALVSASAVGLLVALVRLAPARVRR